jgi:5-methylcytosine-specific restriction endonuclease McrA
MSDQPITKYWSRKLPNPYLMEDPETALEEAETPLPEYVWLGNAKNKQWRELKAEITAERGAQCERCGRRVQLDLHHIKARRIGGPTTKDNVQLLCEPCHVQTPNYGDRTRLH